MSEPEPIGEIVNLDDLRDRPTQADAERVEVQHPTGEAGLPPRVPPRYAIDLEELDQTPAVKAARQWIDDGSHGGLLMVGPVGPGKSTLAGALALILGAPYRCSFWPVPDLVAAVKDEINHRGEGYGVAQKIKRRPVLVLDDIGTESDTDWQRKVLTDLIAYFYDQELTLIATTNLTSVDLEQALGERTASRLTEMCTLIPMTGRDRRRA